MASGGSEPGRRFSLTDFLVGAPRNIRDARIFRSLSLVAFLAWVGLGSDGLSSSCYGPEEAFLALGHARYLAVFLALMTALTVFVISASYSQTIDLFPSGGGGYLVASSLLGSYAGLVSGCALVVDYVLTISISIASGADALFSFLPTPWLHWKLWLCLAVVLMMVGMNLRGVKEAVLSLLPIFIAFVLMHVWLVGYALLSRGLELPAVFAGAMHEVRTDARTLGWLGLAVVFFRAYSMGGGTYTGIEAVSNGLPILREPKTVTGKWTMLYMAVSLAFIAGGILLGYLLEGVEPQTGMTLNAVLFQHVAARWRLAGLDVGGPVITFALLTEGALLFVAAQTGFIDGPRVLATMAHDRWLPQRLCYLSTRLVTQDGVLAMGAGAALILLGTGAKVDLLVVLYAINVFVTFTLSQFGMSVHWWRSRASESRWRRKLAVNGVGCLFTASILVLTVTLKFDAGGWVTLVITGALIALCLFVRRHYGRFAAAVERLETDLLPQIYTAHPLNSGPCDPGAPTAVILASGFNGLGLAALLMIQKLFPNEFRNVIFVGVGEVDSSRLKSVEDIERLEKGISDDMLAYGGLAKQLGYNCELRSGIAADVIAELRRLCMDVVRSFPRPVFFAAKLVFEGEAEGFLYRFLHNHTALEMQSWLQIYGYSLVILPVLVKQGARGLAPPEPAPERA